MDKQLIESDPLYATMGLVRLVEMDPSGRAILEYQALAEQCHSGGVVQGGFVTGWVDAAMAHGCMARYGADRVPLSLDLKMSFFAPARPGLVIAEGWVERGGKRTVFCEGQLKDAAGAVLAKASSTIVLVDKAKVEHASREAQHEPLSLDASAAGQP